MSDCEPSLPPVDPAKKQTFLMIMHTAIAAARTGDPEIAALEMSIAINASERIPADLSAAEAARTYAFHAFQDVREEQPPKWTGLLSRAEFEAMQGLIEERVDGEYRVENPRWLGLPGEDSRYLNLLAHIRDHASATFEELSSVLPHVDPKALAQLLRNAEADNFVRRTHATDGPKWSASAALTESRPSAKRYAEAARWFDQPQPTETSSEPDETSAVLAGTREDARTKQNLAANPDANVLLSELRGSRGSTSRELGRQLPHLHRSSVLRLLKRLRDAGLVEVVGEKRSAFWRLPSTGGTAPAKIARRAKAEERKDRSDGPKPRPDFRRVSEAELASAERFVAENPGCKIGEIAASLQIEVLNRVRTLTEKLYGQRRIYRRWGHYYPGVDPDWP